MIALRRIRGADHAVPFHRSRSSLPWWRDRPFFHPTRSISQCTPEAARGQDGSMIFSGRTGTGKSSYLLERVQHFINEKNVPASAISILVPTPMASRKMEMGISAATRFVPYQTCQIQTFEGYASRLLRHMNKIYSDQFKFQSVEPAELFLQLCTLLPPAFADLPPSPTIRYFAHLHQQNISPQQVSECALSGEEKSVCSAQQLGEYYAAFVRYMEETHPRVVLSTSSCVSHLRYSLEALIPSHPDMQEKLQEGLGDFRHLFWDDLQFFGDEHLQLLQLLKREQLVPQWESATFAIDDSLRLGHSFQSTLTTEAAGSFLDSNFPNPNYVVPLSEQFRVHPALATLNRSLSQSVQEREEVLRQHPSHVSVSCFKNQAQGIAEAIQTQLQKGVPDDQILVLVRTNNEVQRMCEQLEACGVPTQSSGVRLFDISISRLLVSYLLLLIDQSQPKAYWDLLSSPSPFAISPELLDSLVTTHNQQVQLNQVENNSESIEQALRRMESSRGTEDTKSITQLLRLLKIGRIKLADNAPVHRVADDFKSFLQLDDYLASGNASNSDYLNISRVMKTIISLENESGGSASDVIRDLHRLRCHSNDKTVRWEDEDCGRIRVMTIHRALMEGTHSDVVFLPHFTQSNFPLRWANALEKFVPHACLQWNPSNESESDLLSAAISRASSMIHFSYESTQSPSPWIPTPSGAVEESASPSVGLSPSDQEDPLQILFTPEPPKFVSHVEEGSGPHPPCLSYHTVRTAEKCELKYLWHKQYPTPYTRKQTASLKRNKAQFSHLGILLRLTCPSLFDNSFWIDYGGDSLDHVFQDTLTLRHAAQQAEGNSQRSLGIEELPLENQLATVLKEIGQFVTPEFPMLAPAPSMTLQFCDGDITILGPSDPNAVRSLAKESVIMDDKLAEYGMRSGRFQVELYLYLYERCYGTRPTEATIHFYHPAKTQKIIPSDKLYQRMENLTTLIQRLAQEQTYRAMPDSFTCKSCKFVDMCPSSSYNK